MFSINIQITSNAPDFIIKLNEMLREAGKVLIKSVKNKTPIGKRNPGSSHQGRSLKGSTAARIHGSGENQELVLTQNARTSEGVSYGVFVREGTAAHDILPRNKKVLRFYIGSKIIFAKKVHHPGNKPNPYHLEAANESLSQIEAIGQKIFNSK
jgi:hypothetical protein